MEEYAEKIREREIICSTTGKKEIAEMWEDENGYMWEGCNGCGCFTWTCDSK